MTTAASSTRSRRPRRRTRPTRSRRASRTGAGRTPTAPSGCSGSTTGGSTASCSAATPARGSGSRSPASRARLSRARINARRSRGSSQSPPSGSFTRSAPARPRRWSLAPRSCAGLPPQHLQDGLAGCAVDLDARGRLQRFGVCARSFLDDGLHVKLHRFGVTVNLDNTYFGAFFVPVLVERKQPGFVLLNELHQPRHPLALVLELSFLEPVRGNEDERS